MKKKILAVLCVVLIVFNCMVLPVAAVAVPTIIAGALVVIGTINDVYDFAQLICDTWNDFRADLAKDLEIKQIQIYAYWNEFIMQGNLLENDFRSYYTEVVNCAGNSAYFDNVPLTDGQIAVVNAYEYVLDTSANGISLDDICSYCFGDDGVAVDNPDTDFDDNGNITVSGEIFSDICDRLASQYAPDAKTEYISWRNEVNKNNTYQLSFYAYGQGLPTGTAECYLMPFYDDGTDIYYGKFQYRIYISDGYMYLDVANILDKMIDGETSSDFVNNTGFKLNIETYNYGKIGCVPLYRTDCDAGIIAVYAYSSYDSYISKETTSRASSSYIDDVIFYYNSSNVSACVDVRDIYEPFYVSSTGYEAYDIGYMISDKPIAMDGIIQPIPVEHLEDTTVTLAGDTIYDYTITNNTTGDTSTVNYYVNNNYTYENTNDDNDDTSSGGISGDVTVSGDIEVGGKVDVNVDVNINQTGSNGTAEASSSMPVEVDLNNYLEKAPEQAKPITQFFEVFFDFLPPELLALICLGVVVAILLRVWGR